MAAEVGIDVEVETDTRATGAPADPDRRLQHLMRHLCLPPERAVELAAVDTALWPLHDREVAAVWWDV